MSKIIHETNTCPHCSPELNFDFTFAFQPIVDIRTRSVFSYEALVRGRNNEPAPHVLNRVDAENRYRFDQECRTRTIHLACHLNLQTRININFLPNAVYDPEKCLQSTLKAARFCNFPIERIVFEVTEGEYVEDKAHLAKIINYYQGMGFSTAIDDFGAGYSGLNLLAAYQPDYIKLDIQLIRDIHLLHPKQAIVRGIVQVCRELNIELVAEGVEKKEELAFLRKTGIFLYQGFYFARPAFESLPEVSAESYDV